MAITGQGARASSDRPDIDDQLLSPAYIESPYETYDVLRTQAPVYWSARWSAWIVTRYDDVLGILRDHRHFSNQGRYTRYIGQLPVDQQRQLTALIAHYEHGGLVQLDPPAHTRLRRLVNLAFTPRAVAHMRILVEDMVDRLLDDAQERGQLELVHDVAFPLLATVIAGMLGVPAAERDGFKWTWHSLLPWRRSGAAGGPDRPAASVRSLPDVAPGARRSAALEAQHGAARPGTPDAPLVEG